MRIVTTALVLLFAAAPALAGQLAGVTLPDQVTAGGKILILNGLGLREATVLQVDVYVAGLYLEEKSSDGPAIAASGGAKQILIKFMRSIGREELAEAWTEGFTKNAGGQAASLAGGLATLNGAMSDVKKGDQLALTYVPGTGTTVTMKGTDAALIAGEDFQRVLFSIWLGASPPNVSLREGLLGRASKR